MGDWDAGTKSTVQKIPLLKVSGCRRPTLPTLEGTSKLSFRVSQQEETKEKEVWLVRRENAGFVNDS